VVGYFLASLRDFSLGENPLLVLAVPELEN